MSRRARASSDFNLILRRGSLFQESMFVSSAIRMKRVLKRSTRANRRTCWRTAECNKEKSCIFTMAKQSDGSGGREIKDLNRQAHFLENTNEMLVREEEVEQATSIHIVYPKANRRVHCVNCEHPFMELKQHQLAYRMREG